MPKMNNTRFQDRLRREAAMKVREDRLWEEEYMRWTTDRRLDRNLARLAKARWAKRGCRRRQIVYSC